MRGGPLRPEVGAALVTGYAVTAAAGVLALLTGGTDPVAVAVLGGLAAAGLAGGVARFLRQHRDRLARLAEDVEVVVGANPAHRLPADAGGGLAGLVAAVNRLADERDRSRGEAAATAADLRREVESERNRLAELLARLGVAVVVCNTDGRILLYNDSARALVADPTLLGLGRTVFGLVDRGLLVHARQRLEAGSAAYTATTMHRGRMLRVHVAPVHERPREEVTGLVLVLEDLTREAGAAHERQRTLRGLTEETRASLGSIRAAVDAVLEFPDLAAADRQRFLEVVREETERLGRRLDGLTAGVHAAEEGGLDDISAADLATVLLERLRHAGIACRDVSSPGASHTWVRADSHALAAVVVFVMDRLGGPGLAGADLDVTATPDHVRLDLRWAGDPPPPSALGTWLDELLGDEGRTRARQVLDRHAAEVWTGPAGPGAAHLTLLLPRAQDGVARPSAESRAAARAQPVASPRSRPEFYDFDLFGSVAGDPEPSSRALDALTFTVLDTETTGLDPDGGDRIVSLGAVRVVHGRVLRQEVFERLVNPGRPVPAAASAIHGLTDAILADAPPLDEVLPHLVRFAEDTVLVGHDIGFDLRFLEPAARSAGVRLGHPVLDTLLLDAVLYPSQPDHTLEAIAARLGIGVVGRHTALGDALMTADVLVALIPPLKEAGIHTLADALTASKGAFRSRSGITDG
ncbi:MAG: exonuclease domain-containing protein [Actinomycetes bacterium]